MAATGDLTPSEAAGRSCMMSIHRARTRCLLGALTGVPEGSCGSTRACKVSTKVKTHAAIAAMCIKVGASAKVHTGKWAAQTKRTHYKGMRLRPEPRRESIESAAPSHP
eukprot:4659579-Pleurochrysis_carterae.AAC.2